MCVLVFTAGTSTYTQSFLEEARGIVLICIGSQSLTRSFPVLYML